MPVDERRRSHLYDRLVDAVGEEAAVTMFELLPPADTDLATRADLELLRADLRALDARMEHGFALIDQRFEGLEERFEQRFEGLEQRFEQRFGGVEQRFEGVEQRFAHVEQRFDERFEGLEQRFAEGQDALRHELMAAFRGEIVAAVSGQTRAVITAVAITLIGLIGLAVAVGQLL